jgi:hypothetical protein
VDEGAGTLTVTVTRTGQANGPVTASYLTTAGTATAGADYTHTAGSVTFADGDQAPKTFSVPIINDAIEEAAESFSVRLSITNGSAALGTPSEAIVTIHDNDLPTATPTPTLTPTPSPTATGYADGDSIAVSFRLSPISKARQLLNIATRLRVQTGENVLIGGVIVGGT